MTQKKKKKIIMAVLSCASMSSFMGCSSGENTTEDGDTEKTISKEGASSVMEIVKNENLAIDPNRCIGCGKCPRIASANFAMNKNRKAEVISQEVTSRVNVDRAVSVCPTNAISQ